MERRNRDLAQLALVSEAPRIDGERRARYERYLAEILESLGLSLAHEGTRHTPARVLQAGIDATSGDGRSPKPGALFPIGEAGEKAEENTAIGAGTQCSAAPC